MMVHDLETLKQLNDKACSDSAARLASFVARIRKMNETFELESNDKVTDLGYERLCLFYKVIREEVEELDDLMKVIISGDVVETYRIDMVGLADVLGDIVVYAFSEARRWGIPLLEVLHLIMDSQDSKLVDGKPLKAEDGSKFIKGPNYVPPEERIGKLLKERS
jgi:hypothetical protein